MSKLITIHTDNDFSIFFDGKKLPSCHEKYFIKVDQLKDFHMFLSNGRISTDDEEYNSILWEMAFSGEEYSEFGNYSFQVEDYNDFIFDLTLFYV